MSNQDLEGVEGSLDREFSNCLRGDEDFLKRLEACRSAQAKIVKDATVGIKEASRARLEGVVFGDYRILGEIGRGGMGVVYEAEQMALHRRVALKTLATGLLGGQRSYERFAREARAAAALHHHNIVPVYDFGECEGTPFYSMEFIEGRPLDRVIGEMRSGEEKDRSSATGRGSSLVREFCVRAAEMFAGVAEALDFAHSKGIIHRDIKPSNLILDEKGRLLITDFGLARREGSESLTLSGELLGTPNYMSPEQAMAGRAKLDHRTDIYSLGATLYETLTLRPPFSAADHHVVLSHIISRDPVPPRRLNPRVPADIETIILKAMEKDPDRRYGTARELAEDLRSFSRGDAIRARPIGPITRLLRKARRRPVVTSTAAALAISLIFIALLGWSQLEFRRKAREEILGHVIEEGMSLLFSIVKTPLHRSAPEVSVLGSGFRSSLLNIPSGGSSVEEAVRLLEGAAREFSGRAEPFFYLALAQDENHDGAAADQSLDRALAADPGFAPARIFRARRLAAAKGAVSERSADAGQVPQEYLWAIDWFGAQDAERQLEWKKAREGYSRLLETRQEPYRGFRYQCFLRRSQAAMREGDFEEAKLDLARAEGAWEKRPEAELVEAIILRHQGKTKESDDVISGVLDRAGWERKILLKVIDIFGEESLNEPKKQLVLLEAGLTRYPRDEELMAARVAALGRINENEEKVSDAVSAAQELVALYPDSPRAQIALGDAYLAGNFWREAVDTFRSASKLRPDDPFLWSRLGEALSINHRAPEAEDCLRRSMELRPTCHALLCLADMVCERGQFAEGKRMLRKALAFDPLNKLIQRKLGMLEFQAGKWDTARKTLRAADSSRGAWSWLGSDLAPLDPESGLRFYTEFHPDTFFGLGWLYTEIGFAEEAEELLRALPADQILDAEVYLSFFQGRYKDALELLHTLASRKGAPADPFKVTWVAFAIPDFQEGIPAFFNYVRQVPNPHSPWYFYTDFIFALKPLPEVEASWRDLAALHPDQNHIKELLAEAYFRAGKYDQAIAELEALAKRGMDNEWYSVAFVLKAFQPLQKRLQYLSELLARLPKSPAVLSSYAEALEDSGQWEKALECYLNAARKTGDPETWHSIAGSVAQKSPFGDQIQFWRSQRASAGSIGNAILSELGSRKPEKPIRINCGGKSYIDELGEEWLEDIYWCRSGSEPEPKGKEARPVEGTREQALYKTQRVDGWRSILMPSPLYRVPVLSGDYLVTLHFAEIWNFAQNPGLRSFDVLLEDQEVLKDLDICREAGYLRPLKERFEVHVGDGVLDVTFRRRTLSPKICAMEILPLSRGYYEGYRDVAEAAFEARSPRDEAIRYFQREAGAHPERAEAHHLLGELELRHGELTEAAKAFRRSLSCDPERRGSRIRLGDALRAAGDFRGALVAYREVARTISEPTFSLWASLAAASRNALDKGELRLLWEDMKKDRREDSSAWDFAAFFEEQDASQAIRIHCGGEEIRSLDGVFYGHDRCYLGGRLWHTENNEVAVLYRDARWTTPAEQSFAYAIPLLRGSYQVALHFAEIVEARGAPGKRLFDVAIEGKKVLESFDIAKEAGFRKPLTKTFETKVEDGLLEIELTSVKNGPIVSGIEVTPLRP